jgi:hypothetical protein
MVGGDNSQIAGLPERAVRGCPAVTVLKLDTPDSTVTVTAGTSAAWSEAKLIVYAAWDKRSFALAAWFCSVAAMREPGTEGNEQIQRRYDAAEGGLLVSVLSIRERAESRGYRTRQRSDRTRHAARVSARFDADQR